MDDEQQIAAYVFEAFRLSGVEVDPEAFHLYVRSVGKASQVFFSSPMNALADEPGSVCLVIDDFHQIASPSLLTVIDRWLALTPSNFHIVLGSRLRPPLDLARYASADQLTELAVDRSARPDMSRFAVDLRPQRGDRGNVRG